ncbi:MAG: molybdopterin molybdotransferase MoeA [Firmicutes bacterium]|nr:molybdopterin molybdotransferase MoeA [Bacillota bacterium]
MAFLSVEEALRVIEETPCLDRTERVSVFDCCGRVAAEDIVSAADQPPFDRSPLDGFAFRSEDVAGASAGHPARLRQAGYVPAGCGETFAVGPGECVRIMTGGRIPADCDAVVGIEDADYEEGCDRDGDTAVRIYKAVGHHQNYVFAGEDFARGEVLCKAGERIDAAMAACLSAAGIPEVPVRARFPVFLLSTGSEICRPDEPLTEGKIHDSNAVYLSSRLKELGFSCKTDWASDDEALLKRTILESREQFPLILTTGGVSVGDFDLMPKVLAELGARILFHGVSLKPGSPLMLARLGACHILCLSGNPYAAAATFELFARPLLAKLSADPSLKMAEAEGMLAEPFRKGSAVPRYLRARFKEGLLHVPQGHASGQMLSMAGCDCLAELPAGEGPFEAGTKLKVYLL